MDPIYKCQVALDLDIGAIISGRLVAGAKDLNVRNTVIIGAGIIGLAIAHHLQKDGVNVTVVDRDPEGDKASFGNAGGFAVTDVVPASVPGLMWRVPRWLIDPLGPLSIRPLHAPRLIPWLLRFSRSGSLAESSRIAKALSALNSRTYDDLLPMPQDSSLGRREFQEGLDRSARGETASHLEPMSGEAETGQHRGGLKEDLTLKQKCSGDRVRP